MRSAAAIGPCRLPSARPVRLFIGGSREVKEGLSEVRRMGTRALTGSERRCAMLAAARRVCALTRTRTAGAMPHASLTAEPREVGIAVRTCRGEYSAGECSALSAPLRRCP